MPKGHWNVELEFEINASGVLTAKAELQTEEKKLEVKLITDQKNTNVTKEKVNDFKLKEEIQICAMKIAREKRAWIKWEAEEELPKEQALIEEKLSSDEYEAMAEHEEEHATELETQLDELTKYKEGELVEENPQTLEEIRDDMTLTTGKIQAILAEILAYEPEGEY